MAGFFGLFDYTKPGPGVPKDAPPKARIIVFFEILGRKFWNLIKINLLFLLFNLPAIPLMLFISMFYIRQPLEDITLDIVLRFMLGTFFMCIPVITIGPAQAGLTYLLRNYAREEHAFIWWDFRDTAKSNFKQSLLISLIDAVIMILAGITINFYMIYGRENILFAIASGIVILAFIIFVMMHLYIYPMLVTFKLTIRQIYKNAFLFALVKFIPNLLILFLCFALVFVSFINYFIGFVLMLFLTFSLMGLITNFYVYPILKKYMIDKVEGENSQGREDSDKQEPDIQESGSASESIE
ncbi:MAG TPA: DUF624 domain-containing protein [Clostridiaceae bacterium]|nr:DUF624 domain-containing protein [Clostridiaceae bacterium]